MISLRILRDVNERERTEGLTGLKYGFVEMEKVSSDNFHNILSEFHLRPYKARIITEKDLNKEIECIQDKMQSILSELRV